MWKSITYSFFLDYTSTTKMEALTQTYISFYLSPCSSQELSNLIKKLKINKAKKTSDIETRFVKYANPIISVSLGKLINSCISDETLKVAKVIPIFKNGNCDRTTIYGPISLLSQFKKFFENYYTIASIRI